MKKQEQILIQTVLAAVTDTTAPEIDDFEAMVSLSRYHLVHNIIAETLLREESLPENIRTELINELTSLIIKDANQESETVSLMAFFEENKIPVILLKGWYLKKLYPRTDLRAMADTDIFIRQIDEKIVHEMFKSRDYEIVVFGEKKDNIYRKKPLLIFEIHKNLFMFEDDWNDLFNNENSSMYIWDRTVEIEGYEYVYRMDDELFFTYMIAHIAKHLLDDGGIGLKSILDVWLFLKGNSEFDLNKAYDDLEKLELKEFSKNVILLSEYWFSRNNDVDEKVKMLGNHILDCGAYGNSRVMVATKDEILLSENPSTFKYLFYRAFPKFESMKTRFPQLNSKKWLLPFLYVKRLWYSLIYRRKEVKGEINSAKNIDLTKAKEIQRLYKDIGLR